MRTLLGIFALFCHRVLLFACLAIVIGGYCMCGQKEGKIEESGLRAAEGGYCR
jgi:hypothetical protein